MPVWLLALFFAAGSTAFIYTKIVRANGDADHRQNAIITGVIFIIIYIVFYTLIRFIIPSEF